MRSGPGNDMGERWIATWAAAQQLTEEGNLPPHGLSDTTLRQVVHVSLGGSRLRVGFSNVFGTERLKISSACVAPAKVGGAIQESGERCLTFNGENSVTIARGARVISDPLLYHLQPLSGLAVTAHVSDRSESITGHPGARCTTYLQAGNSVLTFSLIHTAATTDHWYYLDGVDVEAHDSAAVVAAMGDSITDGRGSTPNRNGRWTDVLARRLRAAKSTSNIGVVNVGIGGNRLLEDGLGPSGLARLERDVFERPGVRWLILLEGINDLGTGSASVHDLIAGYAEVVRQAHARGIRVYGGTLTPCGGSDYFYSGLEAARKLINEWMRSEGQFDGVVDFDAATRDPSNPARLLPVADSGDHLHLSDAGYLLMGEAVDLGLFLDRG